MSETSTNTLAALQAERSRIEADLAAVADELREHDPQARLAKLQAALDEAVCADDKGAVNVAAKRLQRAQTGADDESRTVAILEARRRALEATKAENAAQIEAAEQRQREEAAERAQEALAVARDQYAAAARALLDTYPRLYVAMERLHHARREAGHRFGVMAVPAPVLGVDMSVQMPNAWGCDLPEGIAGGRVPMGEAINAARRELAGGPVEAVEAASAAPDVVRAVG